MKKAALYIRVSTDEQIEYSPDSQLREMRKWAKSNEYVILEDHIYIDDGISGRRAEKRPEFLKMMSAAHESSFDALLIYKFSRFARSREDSVIYKSILRKRYGIDVISITEPIDQSNKMSVVMEAVIEAMDEYYSLNLSEDVIRTMTEKAMRGELQTAPPFGYYADNNRLVPKEDEAKTVKTIFRMFIDGNTTGEIARYLNQKNITTKRKRQFDSRAVRYILKNPVYTGIMKWTPGPDKAITVENCHKPLISKKSFDIAQSKLNATVRAPKSSHTCDLFSGIFFCNECGRTYVKSGKYRRCSGYAHGKCSNSRSLDCEYLNYRIQQYISSIFCCTKSADYELTDIIESEHNKLRKKSDRLLSAYLSGAISDEQYNQKAHQLKAALEDADKKAADKTDGSVRDILSCNLSDEELSVILKALNTKGIINKKGEILLIFTL